MNRRVLDIESIVAIVVHRVAELIALLLLRDFLFLRLGFRFLFHTVVIDTFLSCGRRSVSFFVFVLLSVSLFRKESALARYFADSPSRRERRRERGVFYRSGKIFFCRASGEMMSDRAFPLIMGDTRTTISRFRFLK